MDLGFFGKGENGGKKSEGEGEKDEKMKDE